MADVASTGIPALDQALGGGLRKGYTVLVGGPPGSGTELFAKQFAAAGAKGENVVYFTTTERDEDVLETLEAFGLRTDLRIVNLAERHYESVLARRLEVSRYRLEGIRVGDLRSTERVPARQPREVNLMTALTYEVSKLRAPFRVVIDSLDFFFETYPHAEVLSALRTIKGHTQHQESVALVTMLRDVYDTRTQSNAAEIADLVIELERVRDGDAFKRYLILRKVRNHPERTGIYPCDITKRGITPL